MWRAHHCSLLGVPTAAAPPRGFPPRCAGRADRDGEEGRVRPSTRCRPWHHAFDQAHVRAGRGWAAGVGCRFYLLMSCLYPAICAAAKQTALPAVGIAAPKHHLDLDDRALIYQKISAMQVPRTSACVWLLCQPRARSPATVCARGGACHSVPRAFVRPRAARCARACLLAWERIRRACMYPPSRVLAPPLSRACDSKPPPGTRPWRRLLHIPACVHPLAWAAGVLANLTSLGALLASPTGRVRAPASPASCLTLARCLHPYPAGCRLLVVLDGTGLVVLASSPHQPIHSCPPSAAPPVSVALHPFLPLAAALHPSPPLSVALHPFPPRPSRFCSSRWRPVDGLLPCGAPFPHALRPHRALIASARHESYGECTDASPRMY